VHPVGPLHPQALHQCLTQWQSGNFFLNNCVWAEKVQTFFSSPLPEQYSVTSTAQHLHSIRYCRSSRGGYMCTEDV
jgi:hypothetical protein